MHSYTKTAIKCIHDRDFGETWEGLFLVNAEQSILLVAELAIEVRKRSDLKQLVCYNKDHMPISLWLLAFPNDDMARDTVYDIVRK